MTKIESANKKLQFILSLLGITVLVLDLFKYQNFHQETIISFTLLFGLTVNSIRQILKTPKLINLLTIIGMFGLLFYSFHYCGLIIWGIAFMGGKVPLILKFSIILIIITFLSVLIESVMGIKKLLTTQG